MSYLIDEIAADKELDMHWTPINKFCTPCQVKFDVIVKFETLGVSVNWHLKTKSYERLHRVFWFFQDDQRYLIEKAGLARVISPQWKNSGKGKSTKELIQSAFVELSPVQIRTLYDFFRYDFELFDYSAAEYFSLQPNTTANGRHLEGTPIATPRIKPTMWYGQKMYCYLTVD